MYVVEYDGLSMARSFREANISGDDGLENLGTEEASKIGSHLFREGRAVVIHRQQDALDGERRIDGAAEAHKGIEKFGNTLESEVLALYGDQDGISSSQSVQR